MFDNFDIIQLILTVAAVLITLSIHEFAHGYVAYKLGDHTARALGRLTLNPIRHIDPLGALCMVLFNFGWAKPVPINPRNFMKPKRDFALTATAGPAINIIVGFFAALIYLIFNSLYFRFGYGSDVIFLRNLLYFTTIFFYIFHTINIGLGIFNLLPIPPFDGSRLLNVILPSRIYFKVMKYERHIYWGVVAWLLLGTYVYRALISIPFIASNAVLSGISRIFSLSGLISDATGFLSDQMIRLWSLIPFL